MSRGWRPTSQMSPIVTPIHYTVRKRGIIAQQISPDESSLAGEFAFLVFSLPPSSKLVSSFRPSGVEIIRCKRGDRRGLWSG